MSGVTDEMVEMAAEAIFNESGTARLQTWEQYRAFYAERGVLSPDYYGQARAALAAALSSHLRHHLLAQYRAVLACVRKCVNTEKTE